jgi:hypothetical protein
MDAFLVLETLSLVKRAFMSRAWFSIYSSFKIKSFLLPGTIAPCRAGMLGLYYTGVIFPG